MRLKSLCLVALLAGCAGQQKGFHTPTTLEPPERTTGFDQPSPNGESPLEKLASEGSLIITSYGVIIPKDSNVPICDFDVALPTGMANRYLPVGETSPWISVASKDGTPYWVRLECRPDGLLITASDER